MNADRNLLFGILALQMDFIGRGQLIAAMHAWVLAKGKPLGEILVEQGAMDAEQRDLLEPLVDAHVRRHGGAEQSLAALSSAEGLARDLAGIADADIEASLAHVAIPRESDIYADPEATRSQRLGIPTGDGTRYVLLRPHARGGLGEVSVAMDGELQREVALKELQARHADSPEARARFVSEAKITGGLEHPGIVPVYGLGQHTDGRPYYAMRFIRGDSLKDAIERFHARPAVFQSLEFRQLLGRFVDVCNAIAYAHSRGVLHRDLKPGNIMLGKYGETLVVDWGLAKTGVRDPETAGSRAEPTLHLTSDSGPATMPGSTLGTPGYMSPEQAAGRLDLLGPASDVYSLGATLYSLLVGQPAFQGELIDVLMHVQKGEFVRPRQRNPRIPAALEAVCLKAMALRPEDRYASPEELAQEIEHWLADEPVTAWQEPLTIRLGRWMRRHRPMVAGAAAALLVALLAGGAGALWLQQEQAQRSTRQQLAEREITNALDEAERYQSLWKIPLQDPVKAMALTYRFGEWQSWLRSAGEALRRAEGVAAGAPGPVKDDLRQRITGLRGQLDADALDQGLAVVLDKIRLDAATWVDGKFDKATARRRYSETFPTFARQDADVAGLAAEVRKASVRWLLVAALDHWAEVGEDDTLRKRLLGAARLADPDPWRDQVRDPARWKDKAKLEELARGADVQRQPPSLLVLLAFLLNKVGADEVVLLKKAQRHYPADFWINFDLGNAEKEPIRSAGHCQVAIALRPDNAAAHVNLGNALADQKDLSGAVAAYNKAIALDPKHALAHYNLAFTLREQNDLSGAIEAYKKAIALDPNDPAAHNGLGNALAAQQDLSGAIAAYKKAIALDPKYAIAHLNLGIALSEQNDFSGAIEAYKKAIALDPKKGHYSLGLALHKQKDLQGAVEAYKRAVALDPQHAMAQCNLGLALQSQGFFAEALVHLKQGHELGSKRKGWPYPSANWVRQCERQLELADRLPGLLKGESQAKDNKERLEFVVVCRLQNRNQSAARILGEAFTADPKLAVDLKGSHRYNAACYAALAAAGQGVDAPKDEKDRAELRQKALAWLRADLTAHAKFLAANPSYAATLHKRLEHWQRDPDLAGVRTTADLSRLPQEEQAAWQKLWAEVEALRKTGRK